jgi:hypothetical protein
MASVALRRRLGSLSLGPLQVRRRRAYARDTGPILSVGLYPNGILLHRPFGGSLAAVGWPAKPWNGAAQDAFLTLSGT